MDGKISVRLCVVLCVLVSEVGFGASARAASPIDKKYNQPGIAALLGPSVNNEISVCGDGLEHDYQNGNIYWSEATGAHEVHGAIVSKLEQFNYTWCNSLGFPKTDEIDGTEPGERQSIFQHGAIYFAGTAHIVAGRIYHKWIKLGGPLEVGPPTDEEAPTPTSNAEVQDFAGRGDPWSIFEFGTEPDVQTTSIHGSIRAKFVAFGGPSHFGPPLTDEKETPAHLGRYNDFALDSIVWNKSTGLSYVLHDDNGSGDIDKIRSVWVAEGRDRSASGVPTSDPQSTTGGGVFNTFGGNPSVRGGNTGGVIIYNNYPYGTHPVFGLTFNHWVDLGREGGTLGFPVSDRKAGPGDATHYGTQQHFAGGSIYSRVVIRTRLGTVAAVLGEQDAKYQGLDGPFGVLRYPIADTGAVSDPDFPGHSITETDFQRGAITKTDFTPLAFIFGGIFKKWAHESDEEHTETGYPDGDPYQGTQTVGFAQQFSRPSLLHRTFMYANPQIGHVTKLDDVRSGYTYNGVEDCWEHSTPKAPQVGPYGYPITDEIDDFHAPDPSGGHPDVHKEGAYFQAVHGHTGHHAFIYFWTSSDGFYGCYWSIGVEH